MAKSPQPGRSKTRLAPPLTPAQAAAVAAAALDQTLEAVGALAAVRPIRPILALDGPRPADPPSNVKELVVRSLRMVRMADGSGRVSGSFKNGLAVTVGDLKGTV